MNFAETYQLLQAKEPPDRVEYGASEAPIFSRAAGFLKGFDLTMQLQVGCPGGCLYCYVPVGNYFTSPRARGTNGELWGWRVFNKGGAIKQFERVLDEGALSGKTIYWSGVTDAYAAPPDTTREIWARLVGAPHELRPRRIVVQTRFRPDRDAEIMNAYCDGFTSGDGGPPVVVSYSIGTDRDDIIRAWEKSTPGFAHRLKTVETLRKHGLWVVPTLSPFAGWDNLEATLRQFIDWGIRYITVLFFKQHPPSAYAATTPPAFLNYLRAEHPHLLDAAWQSSQLEAMRLVFGQDRVLDGQPGFTSLTRPHKVAFKSPA